MPRSVLGEVADALKKLASEFDPVSASGTVTAANNTTGLTVTLDTNSRPYFSVTYDVGGAATIYVERSNDNTNWKLYDTITLTSAASGSEDYPFNTVRYVRVRCPTTGINITLEVSACR